MPRTSPDIPTAPGLIPITSGTRPSGLLPFSRMTAYRLFHDGLIEIRKIRGRSFVTAASLQHYLDNLPLAQPRKKKPGQ